MITAKPLTVVGLALLALRALANTPEPLDSFLRDGRIQPGLTAYKTADDDAERFSLALLQALDGLQQFSAGLHKLGLRPEFVPSGLPFFRVARSGYGVIPTEPVTPAKVGALFTGLRTALGRANATLAEISAHEFHVEVNISRVRLDLDGDGTCSPDETLVAALGRTLGLGGDGPGGQDAVVSFDSADAMWLKGYTHFLSGILDLLMAYDWRPVWNQCAHLIFHKPEPSPAITRFVEFDGRFSQWADLIAAIHELRLNLVDKEGPRHARDQFISMIACSRISWQRILTETDDNKEWLPSPKQTGPGGAKITQSEIQAWLRILDELEDVASGRKLLPHWRAKAGVGINVEKLVNSPPPLDLVLLLQGSALVPYFEEGEVSDKARWAELTRTFGPNFLRFALWSN